jgi:hypothetical protein
VRADEVLAEAKRRGIEVIAKPTLEACHLLEEVKKGQAYAICIVPADWGFGQKSDRLHVDLCAVEFHKQAVEQSQRIKHADQI